MAAPTTAFTNGTGTISATGEANGLLLAIGNKATDNTRVRVGFSGTFTSVVVAIRGRLRGLSGYYPLRAVNPASSAVIPDSTNVSLTDSTNASVEVDASGCDYVEVWVVSGTPTALTVEAYQFAAPSPLLNVTNMTVSGTQTYTGASTVNVASATAFVVGPNGTTNPTLKVDTNTASAATGVSITGAAAAGGVAVAVLSSGTNEALKIDAKGSGTITLNGTGTGVVTSPRGIVSTGPTAGIGYATGAGGTVTQATSRTTGVTLNTVSGNIVLVSAAGSATPFSFTVTNSAVAAGDTVIVNQKSGTDVYTTTQVTAVAAGSFRLTLANASGTTTEQPVFNFNVIKGVAA